MPSQPDAPVSATRYQPPDIATLDKRIKAADKPGRHLWVMSAAWLIPDPAAIRDTGQGLLDRENLVMMAGPGCFKCEHPYSNRVARQPCRGSVTELQP